MFEELKPTSEEIAQQDRYLSERLNDLSQLITKVSPDAQSPLSEDTEQIIKEAIEFIYSDYSRETYSALNKLYDTSGTLSPLLTAFGRSQAN